MEGEKFFFCSKKFKKLAPKEFTRVIKGPDLAALEGKEVTFDSDGCGSADYDLPGDEREFRLSFIDPEWCNKHKQETLF